MSAPAPNSKLLIAYFALASICGLALAVTAVAEGGRAVEEYAAHHAPTNVSAVVDVVGRADGQTERGIVVDQLPCFACHAITRFRDGGDGHFPHEFHLDFTVAQTCHDCHAFEGHAAPVIAELDECADCH